LVTKNKALLIFSTAAATLLLLAVGTAGLTTTIFAQQNFNRFTAKLSGSNEVPPVTAAGSGIAIFHILPVGHQQVLNYELDLKNIKGVTGAHIHSGKQGENGPVVAGLFNPSMSGPPTGTINGLLTAGTHWIWYQALCAVVYCNRPKSLWIDWRNLGRSKMNSIVGASS
jgi:hypothetical protein